MSKELRWAKNFCKSVNLRSHSKKRVRKKNAKRVERYLKKAFKVWGGIPVIPESM